jgi:formylmethanofuran dehydrogenase subunit D
MTRIRVTLLTGRTIEQGTAKECGKLSSQYRESVAICEMDPADLRELGVKDNSNVKVSTEFGSVVVKAKESRRWPHSKIVYMPYGIWANTVVDPYTHGTGMPSFKGISAEVEPAPGEEVPTVHQILKQTLGRSRK